MLVNPGGPGGSGLVYSVLGAFVPGRRGRELRLDRLRPARRRLERGRTELHPGLLRLRPPELRGDDATARAGLARPLQELRGGVRPQERPGVALEPHARRTPSGTWTRIRQALGPAADQLLRLLVRHLPRPGLRHAVPGAGAADGAGQQRRSAPGVVPGAARSGPRLRPQHQHLLRLDRQVPRRLPPRRRPSRPSRTSTTRQLADLDAHPAGGLIGPDEWTDLFLGAAYYIFGWEDIANAFAGWVHNGDWKPLKALYDSAVGVGDDNNFAVYLGVQCTDAHWPQSYARWRADSRRIYAKAPFADVGQHLVQRAVPVLARTSRGSRSTSTGSKVPERCCCIGRDARTRRRPSRAASRSAAGSPARA